jgi:NAD+ synthase
MVDPSARALKMKEPMKSSEVIEHVTLWLSDYLEESRSYGFVVGVSGGIDSAVASALAARTGKPLLAVEMPIHQNPAHTSRAREHIEKLEREHQQVTSVEVELTSAYDKLAELLPEGREAKSTELALVNTRARLRMTTLYYFAARDRRLVVGTGNKVEDFGVGFFTKYGDGGVDLSPIADLTKTEVRALAAELGIDDAIRDAPPTDGLWSDDRTDEEQLGASYPELERAMSFSGDPDTLEPRERDVLEIYRRFHEANRHKMEPIPVCEIPDALRENPTAIRKRTDSS